MYTDKNINEILLMTLMLLYLVSSTNVSNWEAIDY